MHGDASAVAIDSTYLGSNKDAVLWIHVDNYTTIGLPKSLPKQYLYVFLCNKEIVC